MNANCWCISEYYIYDIPLLVSPFERNPFKLKHPNQKKEDKMVKGLNH
jgi:hypothetical protein